MKTEDKNRIAQYVGTLKSFEIHGGNPADYKEALVNLRDAIVTAIYSIYKYKEKDSNTSQVLFDSLPKVISAISLIDNLRAGKNYDEIIEEGSFIQTLASRLLNNTNMIILDIITK